MFQSKDEDLERLPACPSCGEAAGRALLLTDRGERFDGERAVLCPRCSLVYLNPRLRPEALERYYASDAFSREVRGSGRPSPEAMSYRDMRARRRRHLLEGHLPARASVLEIGCGAGNFLTLLAEAGHEVRGIDPSTGYAAEAKRRGLDVVTGRFPEDLPDDGTRFGVAVLFHVVEHVPDPVALLAAVRERLEPEGLLCLEYPDVALAARRRFLPHSYFERAHLYDFTRATLGDHLGRAGFRVEEAILEERIKPYDRNLLLLCRPGEPIEAGPERPLEAAALGRRLRRRLRFSGPLMPLRPLWRRLRSALR